MSVALCALLLGGLIGAESVAQEDSVELTPEELQELESLFGLSENDTPGCSSLPLGIQFSFDVNTTSFTTGGIPGGQGVPFSQKICFDHDTDAATVCGLDIDGSPLPHRGTGHGACADTSVGPNTSAQQGSAAGQVATSSAFASRGTFAGMSGSANPIVLDNFDDTTTSIGVGARGRTDPNMSVSLDSQGTHRLAGVLGVLEGQSISGGNPNQTCVASGVIGIDDFDALSSSVDTWAGCFEGDVFATGSFKSGNSMLFDGPNHRITTDSNLVIGFENFNLGFDPLTFPNVRVGVGTLSPLSKLHVSGGETNLNIRIAQTGSTAAVLRLIGGTGGRDYGIFSTGSGNTQGAGKLLFFDNQERAMIGSNGFFGIGSFGSGNPSHRLHVRPGGVRFENLPAGSFDDLVVVDSQGVLHRRDVNSLPGGADDDWDIAAPDISFAKTGNVLPNTNDSNDLGSTASRWRDLYLGSTLDYAAELRFAESGTERMRIHPGGNVGIGVANPLRRVEIQGPGEEIFRLRPDLGSENVELLFGAATPNTHRAKIVSSGSSGDLNGDLRFWVNLALPPGMPNPNPIEAMTIRSSGNVGIGTSAPTELLHVVGGARVETLPDDPAQTRFVVADAAGVLHTRLESSLPGGADNDWTGAGTGSMFATDTADFVAIGTSTTELRLTLDNDGGIIAKGVWGSGASLTTSGGGTRMIWYPQKAAFRAGHVDGAEWDDGNIGEFSTALGYGTKATTFGATALGWETEASGNYATALGYRTRATAFAATAMGANSEATGSNSTAIGQGLEVSGTLSVGIALTNPVVGSDVLSQDNTMAIVGGNVGIDTLAPQRKLHISDVMRLEPRATAPGSPSLGDLYVDSDTNELCFYDGTSWTGLKAGGACS